MILRILIVLLILSSGCVTKETKNTPHSPQLILEIGDYVEMDYTGRIEGTGEVFDTTYATIAFNPGIGKVEGFTYKEQYAVARFILGKGQMFSALENGMVGMKIGDERNITLLPEEGYGGWSRENTIVMKRAAIVPKLIEISLSDFRVISGKEPKVDENVNLNYWPAMVVNISGASVTLLQEPRNNSTIDTEFGPARVSSNKTHITSTLLAEPGTIVTTAFGNAIISNITEKEFIIDLNHPLSGKTIVYEVMVRDIIKAQQMLEQRIAWKDYKSGIKIAKKENMPVVMALYINSCHACEVLDNLTLSNPQVTKLRDKFVWIKVDTGANPRVGSEYEVKIYPTIVLLNRNMETSGRITGYISAEDLRKELEPLT